MERLRLTPHLESGLTRRRCSGPRSLALLVVLQLALFGDSAAAQRASRLSIDRRPTVLIGMIDGPKHYMFQFITEVAILPNRDLIIADRAAGELRIFKPTGEFVRSFGGRGAGPGEFQGIDGLLIARDRISVVDPILGKIAHFTLTGDLLSTDRLGRFGASLIGGDSRGRGWWSWLTAQVKGPAPGLTADSISIALSESSRSEFKSVTGTVVRWRYSKSPYPFSPVTRPALLRDSLLVADPIAGRIGVYDRSGKLSRQIAVGLPELDHAAAWRLLEREVAAREDLRSKRGIHIPRHNQLPRMATMLVDTESRIWVKKYDPAEDAHWLGGWAGGEGGEWLILNAAGARLGTVQLPPKFVPLYIGRDVVLGRQRDDLDVQYVAGYRLRIQQ